MKLLIENILFVVCCVLLFSGMFCAATCSQVPIRLSQVEFDSNIQQLLPMNDAQQQRRTDFEDVYASYQATEETVHIMTMGLCGGVLLGGYMIMQGICVQQDIMEENHCQAYTFPSIVALAMCGAAGLIKLKTMYKNSIK